MDTGGLLGCAARQPLHWNAARVHDVFTPPLPPFHTLTLLPLLQPNATTTAAPARLTASRARPAPTPRRCSPSAAAASSPERRGSRQTGQTRQPLYLQHMPPLRCPPPVPFLSPSCSQRPPLILRGGQNTTTLLWMRAQPHPLACPSSLPKTLCTNRPLHHMYIRSIWRQRLGGLAPADHYFCLDVEMHASPPWAQMEAEIEHLSLLPPSRHHGCFALFPHGNRPASQPLNWLTSSPPTHNPMFLNVVCATARAALIKHPPPPFPPHRR